MVTHYCLRCGKSWSRKDVWRKHLKTIKECEAVYLDIDRGEILESYNLYIDDFMELYEKKYKCDNCLFRTKYAKNLRRHKENNVCCQDIVVNNNINNSTNNSTNNSHNNNNSFNSHVDNSVNGDNNRISNNNNYINNYKSEDTTSLTIEKWLEIGDCPPEAISKLVEAIHYKIPENRNIDLPNIRGNYAKVYEDETWKYIRLVQLLEDLLVNNCDRFYDFVKANKEVLPSHWVRGINKMLDEVNKEPAKKVQKELIRNVMLNNRE